MTQPRDPLTEYAARLRDAEADGSSVALATQVFDGLDWQTARQVARANDELRREAGDVLVGYKLGWTSVAMREALGIDRPNWGTLWRSHLLADHSELHLNRFRHAKAEPEIVYFAGKPLSGPDIDAAGVLDAARGWAAGIEVVHPRYESYEFTWLDNTADNSSAGAVVVGDPTPISGDPADIEVEFGDGHQLHTGRGAMAMGSPAEAVAWFVRSLADEGEGLAAGGIVFTGGLTAPLDVVAGRRFTVRSQQLGSACFEADE